VVAIGSAASDVQEKIELGRCRHVVQVLHETVSAGQNNSQGGLRRRCMALCDQSPRCNGR
jgi:hypothetical protein